jgi:hypothetical protein
MFLSLMLGAPALQAQTAIHRCVAANGTPVFTDQPCSSLDATQAATTATGATRSAAPADGICPATPAALKARVANAFNAGDANALAGLMLWQGYGRGAAMADMRRLQSLVREPLLGFGEAADADDDADAPPAWPPFADNADARSDSGDEDANTLTLRFGGVGDAGSGREARFGIVPRAGCLWLQP